MSITGESSEIQEFYNGTNIFITGGTGFVGKLIIEKLLRSCPGIKKIYILCRSKKEKKASIRLTEQFDDIKNNPEFKSKVVAIQGDFCEFNLGISDEDMKMLVNDVNVIFHCGATVRFDEPLRKAVITNVCGSRNLLQLAHDMNHLKAFIHVSTAYSNCVHDHIEEKIYDSPFDSDLIMKIVETVDEDTLDRITPGLLGKHPNTYTYSKAIAEDVIKQNSKGIPVGIVRPAIVISTHKEPVAGWSGSTYGPTGAAAATLLGVLHTWRSDANKIAAIVPADYVVNASIAAAWNVAQSWNKRPQNGIIIFNKLEHSNGIPVYNYSGCQERPMTWGACEKNTMVHFKSMSTVNCMWIYFMIMTKWKSTDFFCRCLFHLLPAYILDGLMFLIGKAPSYVKNYKYLHKMIDVTGHFLSNEWKFETRNTENLYAKLNNTDRELFNFNMSNMDWSEYWKIYATGIRVYILKDPLTTVPQAKRKYMVLKVLNIILLTFLSFLFYMLYVFFRRLF